MPDTRPRLTPQEMQALVVAGAAAAAPQSQTWFFIRTGFCAAFVVANALSLSLYFDDVFGKFDLPASTQSVLSAYIGVRVLIALAIVPLYAALYLKRVWFLQASVALLGLMALNLLNDTLLIYANLRPGAMLSVGVMIFLRLVVMALVALNARFYQRNFA